MSFDLTKVHNLKLHMDFVEGGGTIPVAYPKASGTILNLRGRPGPCSGGILAAAWACAAGAGACAGMGDRAFGWSRGTSPPL